MLTMSADPKGGALTKNSVPLKRVLVIETEALLSAGLVCLMKAQEGLEVHTVEFQNVSALVEVIQSLNPDVIVIDANFLADNVYDFLPIWVEFPKVRVVSMSLNDNNLQVYDKRSLQVKQSKDFFSAI